MIIELLGKITPNKYLHSVIILFVFYILSQLVVFLSQGVILRLAKRTKTAIDDLIVTKTSRPISLILLLIGLRLAIIPYSLSPSIVGIVQNTLASLIIAILTYIAIAIFDIVIGSWGQKFAAKTKSKIDDEVVVLVQRFSRITISFIGLILILNAWGVQVVPLLASLGIAGIAVAFALQSTLGNIFGGISLIADRSIMVDDFIKIDDATEGFVVEIGLRSTKIKNLDGDLIVLPNGKLAESKIYNYHKPLPTTRVTVEFGVSYGSDVAKVRKIIASELKSIKYVLKEPEPKVLLDELGDSALKFKAYFWVNSIREKIDAKDIAVAAVYNALRRNRIGIPFPTRAVYIKRENKLKD